jgi:hypothetical protein
MEFSRGHESEGRLKIEILLNTKRFYFLSTQNIKSWLGLGSNQIFFL